MKHTATNFKAERETLGLSQSEVAQSLGVTVLSVKNWESRTIKTQPPDYAWVWLAQIRYNFNTEVEELVNTDYNEVAKINYYSAGDRASVNYYNAIARIAAEKLRERGVEVEFCPQTQKV